MLSSERGNAMDRGKAMDSGMLLSRDVQDNSLFRLLQSITAARY